MKRLICLLSLLGAFLTASTAQAGDSYPLVRGSVGPHVCALKWMLAGHRPNVFSGKLPGTFRGDPTYGAPNNCAFGDRTAAAVVRYKALLGYPRYAQKPAVFRYFVAFLKGEVKWMWAPGTLNPAVIEGPVLPRGVLLHPGSHGIRVKNLQWLLSGRPPNVYTFTPYFKGLPNGLYGDLTKNAVLKTKWRLGYPGWALTATVGRQLELILTGHKRQPLLWVARAAIRIKAYIIAHTPCADRLIAKANQYLGYHEYPWGSNSGPQVSIFQAVTGQFHAAWCASYAQAMLLWSGYGTIDNRTAYVPEIRRWAAYHGYLHAVARPGALVAWYWDYHHVGIVTQIGASGYYAVSGNSGSVWGGSVTKQYYRYGSVANVFIWLPNCF